MAAPDIDLLPEDPEGRRLEAFAAAAARLEREADLHAAAALFLSVVRQQCPVRRAVLTVTNADGTDHRWFFAGLTDADIDYFHAHRPGAAERAAWLAEKHRAGRVHLVPAAACRDGGGLRNPAAGEFLVLPWRGAAGDLLGMLLIEDGRDRESRAASEIAAIELFGAGMARLLERQRLDRSARQTEARLRQAQEQLMQADKLSSIGQLISGVAHELNNPLSSVMGFTQLLQASEKEAKARQHLDRVYTEAVRCQKIVQNLLTFARRHKPEKVLLNINDVLESTLELCAYQLHVDSIRVQRELQTDLPRTMADFHQMQQVFMNVIINAHQAIQETNRKGLIKVRSSFSDGKVRVEIVDNGPGIQPQNVQKIFDPFFSTRPPGQGVGLGLSICYGILQEHDGRIWAGGAGRQETRIVVELPVLTQAPPRTQSASRTGS